MWLQQNIVWVPGGWFCLNMYWMWICCYILRWYMAYLGDLSTDFVQVSKELNLKFDAEALGTYLGTKKLESSDGSQEEGAGLTKCSWYETDDSVWYGAPPKIEIVYDSVNKWIFSCRLDVDRKKLRVDDPDGKSEEEWAADHFCALLRDAGVLKDGEEERTELGASLGD